jgi:hypothetical protein
MSYTANKYLIKIAESVERDVPIDESARGWVSPYWMENHIASKHGKKTDAKSDFDAIKRHYGSSGKVVSEGVPEGIATGLVGAALGTLVGAATGHVGAGAGAGALLGGYGGWVHGVHGAIKDEARAYHRKYE